MFKISFTSGLWFFNWNKSITIWIFINKAFIYFKSVGFYFIKTLGRAEHQASYVTFSFKWLNSIASK